MLNADMLMPLIMTTVRIRWSLAVSMGFAPRLFCRCSVCAFFWSS